MQEASESFGSYAIPKILSFDLRNFYIFSFNIAFNLPFSRHKQQQGYLRNISLLEITQLWGFHFPFIAIAFLCSPAVYLNFRDDFLANPDRQ
jgi:hypothetical protein